MLGFRFSGERPAAFGLSAALGKLILGGRPAASGLTAALGRLILGGRLAASGFTAALGKLVFGGRPAAFGFTAALEKLILGGRPAAFGFMADFDDKETLPSPPGPRANPSGTPTDAQQAAPGGGAENSGDGPIPTGKPVGYLKQAPKGAKTSPNGIMTRLA